jgi:hypothetical protein
MALIARVPIEFSRRLSLLHPSSLKQIHSGVRSRGRSGRQPQSLEILLFEKPILPEVGHALVAAAPVAHFGQRIQLHAVASVLGGIQIHYYQIRNKKR